MRTFELFGARSHAAAVLIGGAALLAGLGAAAHAQNSGSAQMSRLQLSGKEPIQIESDKLEVRQNENMAIFSGNVSATQGKSLLKAGQMKVFYAKDPKADTKEGGTSAAGMGSSGIDRLEVDGKVYLKSDTQVATGDTGVFDMKSEVLVLSGGQVVLSDGDNVLMGCKLTVQMRSGQAQVEGCNKGGSGGRVIMSITPDGSSSSSN